MENEFEIGDMIFGFKKPKVNYKGFSEQTMFVLDNQIPVKITEICEHMSGNISILVKISLSNGEVYTREWDTYRIRVEKAEKDYCQKNEFLNFNFY